jgi:hypothetical protein
VLAQDEALIRATWKTAAGEAHAIAAEFVRRVCRLAPHLCQLLQGVDAGELDERTQRFVDRLVETLNEPRLLLGLLRDVARAQAGALSHDDYVLLGVCFINAVETVLGPRLDAAARAAGLETVTLLAALMGRMTQRERS